MVTMTRPRAGKIDPRLIQQAKAVDLLALAGQVTTLRRKASQEFEGPCPKCGGTKRFYCTAEWFTCRDDKCRNDKRGDVVEFVQWLHGDTFPQAVARLTNGSTIPTAQPRQAAPQPHTRKVQPQTDQWRHEAAQIHARAKELLWEPEGEPARAYLESRGLTDPRVWEQFELGYRPDTPLTNTRRQPQHAPAIVMPWMPGRKLCALRYRYLQAQTYTDDNGDNRTEKLWSQPGSMTRERLFGGQTLFGCAERFRWLIIVEGELNCMSIWQASYETGVDVLSIGSQSATLPKSLIEYAGRFMKVLVWADEEDAARKLMDLIPGAIGIFAPGGMDANDMLQQDEALGAFIARKRERHAADDDAREALLWALYDAAMLPNGITTGEADVLRNLATHLGKQAEIHNPEPNRWITSWPTSR